MGRGAMLRHYYQVEMKRIKSGYHIRRIKKTSGGTWLVLISHRDLVAPLDEYAYHELNDVSSIAVIKFSHGTHQPYALRFESEHPYLYNCPKTFLSMANKGVDTVWRESVIASIAQEKDLAAIRKSRVIPNMTEELFNAICTFLRVFPAALRFSRAERTARQLARLHISENDRDLLCQSGLTTRLSPHLYLDRVYAAYEGYVLERFREAMPDNHYATISADGYGYGCIRIQETSDQDYRIVLASETEHRTQWIKVVKDYNALERLLPDWR